MLLKKCYRIIKNNGVGTLVSKAQNRLKYKKRAEEYMAEELSEDVREPELKHQRGVVYTSSELISIAVPLYNTPVSYLRQMINSVIAQTYTDWELCLADASKDDRLEGFVAQYTDKRIKYKKLDKNHGISGNTNLAVDMAEGDYVALLDHDDVLMPNALFEYRKRIDKQADVIYCDEASFTDDISKPEVIHFKPDFSPLNLRGNNYICHFLMFKKSLFKEVGGLRAGFEGSQDHDLVLRLTEKAEKVMHIKRVLYMWRIHSSSVAMDISAKPYCVTSGALAVTQQLMRLKLRGRVESIGEGVAAYRCVYPVMGDASCRVIHHPTNKALRGCKSTYVAFLPVGVKLDKTAMRTLMGVAKLEGVGAVGGIGTMHGKVTDGAVRFDGEGGMATAMLGERVSSGGYMQRLGYAQNVNALSLMAVIPAKILAEMHGFDEELPEDERLIDLCLRMRAAGYAVVLYPEVRFKAYPIEEWELSKRFAERHRGRLLHEDEYFPVELSEYIE